MDTFALDYTNNIENYVTILEYRLLNLNVHRHCKNTFPTVRDMDLDERGTPSSA